MAATVADLLRAAAERLGAAGVENPRREAAWLLAGALGVSVSDLRLHPERAVPPAAAATFARWVERRAAREPLQYILGTQEFLGLTFRVTPAVLIPRPETEVLVLRFAEALRDAFPGPGPLRVADIGTGSGCIAVALCRLLPAVEVWAVDLSPEALAVAGENARQHGVADRIHLLAGDLYGPLAGMRLHGIVSNPPYIPAAELPELQPEVRDYEPRLALTPGEDGLGVIRQLIAGAPAHLLPGGVLALEVGAGQGEAVLAMMGGAGFDARGYRDDLGHLRAVVGIWPRAGDDRPGAERSREWVLRPGDSRRR
ncbi:MAG: peptide chain release factor N(5)-glutamine methyltransferase [Firmicutes bacterium]|nr:peptide chain release factor N(5)-glutamine methyltransferase [Bacillota bacterium]